MLKVKIYFFLILLFSNYSFSQIIDTTQIKVLDLNEVIVNSSKIPSRLSDIPLSVNVLDTALNVNILQQNSLKEYINRIPGVFTLNANNFAQDLRISIRGFGARSAFGIRGIKLIVDGIPETTPDGQGQLDNLNLGIIERVEVIRGPSASLYGNASGGVIKINSISNFENNFVNLKSTYGSYGMQNYQGSFGLKRLNSEALVHLNKISSNGYRDRSGIEQTNFLSRLRLNTKSIGVFSGSLSYTDSPYAGDPGGLTDQERNNNRSQARARNIDYDTYESINHFKSSLQWELKNSEKISWNASTFYSKRNFYGKLPFEFGGIVDLDRDFWGGNFNFKLSSINEKVSNTLLLGLDLGFQKDRRKRFKNIKGVQGEITLNQIESFENRSFYLIDHLKYKKALITIGLRWDNNTLATDKTDYSIELYKLNPSIGINMSVSKNKNIWVSFSSSFETPTLSELSSNPYGDSGLNPQLIAQKALNFEFGYRSKMKNKYFEMVAFYIPTDDEITPYEIEQFPGRTFYRNAGKTSRKGIEIIFNHNISKKINFDNSYTFSDFKFREFTSGGNNLNDNYLPGIPKNIFNSNISYKTENGLIFLTELIYNDKIYSSNNNDVFEKPYWLSNFKISKKINNKNLFWDIYFGLNNIFNTYYSDNIRLNAFGGRFFEPAPLRNFYLGLNLKVNN
ncbi:MAG: TonB-dependent receptor family protein [Flavobacteriaceae bacterium]